MRLTSNYAEIITACKEIAALVEGEKSTQQTWKTFHLLTFKLYAQLARNPFILDAVATAAYGNISDDDCAPASTQLDWDGLTDFQASACAAILRRLAFTPLNALELAADVDIPLRHITLAAKRLTAAGMAFNNHDNQLQLSPIGEPAARFFERNLKAMRPPVEFERRNRRRE